MTIKIKKLIKMTMGLAWWGFVGNKHLFKLFVQDFYNLH